MRRKLPRNFCKAKPNTCLPPARFGRIGISLRLVIIGSVLGTTIGVAVGAWGAIRQYRLSDRAINFGHALKNTLVPVITVIGLQLGAIIAFAIITETVFQWPGMGLMFIQAVQHADIPVMAAYLMLVAFLFVLINFIVDLIYVRIDPRIRIQGRGA